jgi:CubicO group peptidase (beta-lactamase class C family)
MILAQKAGGSRHGIGFASCSARAAGLLAVGMGAASGRITSTYLGRYMTWLRPTNYDHFRMPQRGLTASPAPIALPLHPANGLDQLPIPTGKADPALPLANVLTNTGTTALVVLHRGHVAWEYYPNGGSRERLNRCFSVTKSVASALVGAAVGDGLLGSVEEQIGRYLIELHDSPVGSLTIAHLLEMRSGIRFIEGVFPWNDEPRTYYATDMRSRLLRSELTDPVGSFFHYNDWHPLLISLILERTTGKSVTDWMQEKLWNPLGTEYPASMMVDRNDASGLEHLESGLTATAIDLAKFGQLFLQDGVWGGQRLLPAGWVSSTTAPDSARTDAEWFAYYRDRPWGRFLKSGHIYYRRMWWGNRLDGAQYDFFAMGVLGQHIYVSPETQTVIVRLSDRFPPGIWWPPIFRQIARAVDRKTS